MALQVWLPLNGNLDNQGLSGITVTNNGATIDNNGKIGKCYYFDGNAHYLQFSESVGDLYSGDFSYAVWLKPMDDTRSVICSEYASSGSSNIAVELSASRQVRLYWNGSPDISSTGCILPKSQWTHIAITRSGNEAKFYMNGELKYTYTGTLSNKTSTAKIRLGDDYRGGTSVSYMGYMNDFRIYNHALSPKEIEVLSRGLVCHYPLSLSGENLLANSIPTVTSGWNVPNNTDWSRTLVDAEGSYNGKAMRGTYSGTAGGQRGGIYKTFSPGTGYFTEGDTYTITARLRASVNCTIRFYNTYSAAATQNITTEWATYTHTATVTDSTANGRTIMYIEPSYVTTGVWIECCMVKMEKGSKSTPWIPYTSDDAYTALGFNDNVEYDVSGYGHNGTKNGTIVYDSNTARYSVCSGFNGSNTYIEADPLPTETKTISVWIKTTWASSSSYNVIIHDKNTGLAIGWSGAKLITCAGTSGGSGSVIITSGIWTANEWHNVVVVKTGANTRDVYIDAVKMTPSSETNYWAADLNKLDIGTRHYNGSYSGYFDGQSSDFRAYATALTEAQIKELYNTAVSVANNGALMGYELVEV